MYGNKSYDATLQKLLRPKMQHDSEMKDIDDALTHEQAAASIQKFWRSSASMALQSLVDQSIEQGPTIAKASNLRFD
jgi:hypothetical protein